MTIAKELLPTALYVVFGGALISAILSTVDSVLVSASALACHNILGDTFKRGSQQRKVWMGRIMVLCAGIAVYLLALRDGKVYDLVILASSLGTSGALVIVIFALYSKKFGGGIAANTTLIVGLVGVPLFENLQFQAPYITTVLFSFAVYCSIALVEKR